MFKVKTLNHISPVCMQVMTPERYEISDTMEDPDAIFVRATNMHNYEFNPSLRCIARAGIGVNSIPLQRCSEAGIVVFNTPGGNANAVKELFLFGLGMASRDLMAGMRWVYNYNDPDVPVEVAMEKIKKQFAGPEYYRKSIGVIGTGNVGSLVANIALDLGMKVYGYDPYLSVNAAWRVSRHVERVDSLDTLLKNCDYITLHTPLTDETRGMINAERIAKMKDGVRIINYARGEVVDEDAIIDALRQGGPLCGRLPHRPSDSGTQRHSDPPSGRHHCGSGSQLRPDGRRGNGRLSAQRQHQKLCKPARPASGPHRHYPDLHYPPQSARYADHPTAHFCQGSGQHRKYDQQIPRRICLLRV